LDIGDCTSLEILVFFQLNQYHGCFQNQLTFIIKIKNKD
jgi:hypothetical protein